MEHINICLYTYIYIYIYILFCLFEGVALHARRGRKFRHVLEVGSVAHSRWLPQRERARERLIKDEHILKNT